MQNRLILFIVLSLSVVFTATGQKLLNSPYSRFNLGTIQPEGGFRSLGMGRTGTAMRDNSSIYFTNPSSYSSLDTISFVFDFGLDYGRNFLSNETAEYSSDDINFHHLVMGFPIAKGFGVAVGFVPMSSGYYNMAQTVTSFDEAYDPLVGPYEAIHGGTGSISKIFLGTGLNITKNLSVGVNLIILTGELKRVNEFLLGEAYNVFHSSNTESLQLSGINFDYGLQYTAKLKNNYFLNIGASMTAPKEFKTEFNRVSKKYTLYGSADSISVISDKTPTFIPATLRMGISVGKKNKFTAGLDYVMTQWSEARIPGSVGYAANTREMLLGVEYIPERFSNLSFFRRLEYRMGAHMGDNYLIINNEQIKEYGASIGLGLPLRRTFSKVNLFLDFTKKTGSFENNLHNENYLTMGLSLNFYDYWFQKRKYD
jgi:hypothetical protein